MKFLKQQYKISRTYIKKNLKKPCSLMVFLFILSVVVACVILLSLPPEASEAALENAKDMLNTEDMTTATGALSSVNIFFKNLQATVIIVLLGFLPFVFLSGISLGVNGVLVGIMMGYSEVSLGKSALVCFLQYVLPHGIFEIPALVITAAIGTKLCMLVTHNILHPGERQAVLPHVGHGIRVLVLWVIPLMLIAVLVETLLLPLIFLR